MSHLQFALCATLLASPAAAQSIYVCHFSQNGGRHLAAFDAQDGSLQTASFLDLDVSGVTNRPIQAVRVGTEWWVTDNVTETAHVFDRYGVEYRREEFGFNGDTEGAVRAFGSTWFTAQEAPFAPGTLIEVDAGGTTTFHSLPSVDSPLGIGVFGNELVVTDGNGVVGFDPATGVETGALFHSLAQQGMGQPHVRPTTGNLLIPRQAAHSDVVEMDASGNIVQEFEFGAVAGITGIFACLELGNGDFLLCSELGVHVSDPSLTQFTPQLEGVRARMATFDGDPRIGTSYCGPAAANSTGQSAFLSVTGSTQAADGAVRIQAHRLPTLSFGYFLVAPSQGMVVGPGGSMGVLCLGGPIGRHLNQVQNSATVDYFDITVDAGQLPTPTGPTTLLPGATWNWQAWYRDVVGGQGTSNFTDAVSVTFQ